MLLNNEHKRSSKHSVAAVYLGLQSVVFELEQNGSGRFTTLFESGNILLDGTVDIDRVNNVGYGVNPHW